MKTDNKSKRGKLAKASGARFELKVRKDLEEKGFIVDKWSNNVEFEEDIKRIVEMGKKDFPETAKGINYGKLIKAKAKWAGPGRPMMMGSGFPDFVVWHKNLNLEVEKQLNGEEHHCVGTFGVESKMTGKLDKEEKEKCEWLLKNKIFSKILIANKKRNGRKIEIEYIEYGNK